VGAVTDQLRDAAPASGAALADCHRPIRPPMAGRRGVDHSDVMTPAEAPRLRGRDAVAPERVRWEI